MWGRGDTQQGLQDAIPSRGDVPERGFAWRLWDLEGEEEGRHRLGGRCPCRGAVTFLGHHKGLAALRHSLPGVKPRS